MICTSERQHPKGGFFCSGELTFIGEALPHGSLFRHYCICRVCGEVKRQSDDGTWTVMRPGNPEQWRDKP